ncbi:hypothetical protein MPH47_02085 [Psychrobacillus psychrodurans]|uniref:hypothetical protein n=1 Tax=Psychrobacillus TaxID=1221880 RepID=UPI001F4EB4EC|nr:hypothetical protein [Psychrobacillus psychrodurans]MCK1996027.1 hypothetical protein [Psychrobacillus psychrodurans]
MKSNLPKCGKGKWIINMDADSLIPFIVIWGLPAFIVVRTYFKMNTDDKKSAINDFRSCRFVLTIGFIVMGTFFAHLGSLFAIRIMELIGIGFFTLGGFLSAINLWNKNKTKSVIILVLIAFVVLIELKKQLS